MYITDSIFHFRLSELQCIASLFSIFDENTGKKIDDIYSYHRYTLKESDSQPLQFTLDEKNNYLKKLHSRKVFQPEFIFSDDEEIF